MRTLNALQFQLPLALLGGLFSLTTVCWGSVHSDLFIEPGKQFVLGGGQHGAFRVAARNVGKAAVEVKEQPAAGALYSKVTLTPGQGATLRFAAGSAAVLVNSTSTRANLDLRIIGEPGLHMSTENKR